MTPALPMAPAPIADESLPGFVLRVAGLYGHRTLAELGFNISMPGCAFRIQDVEVVAERCGICRSQLMPLSYLPSLRPGHHQFGRAILHRDLIRLGRGRRYCPACLASSAHHRAIWDLSVVRVCGHHQLQLLDCCPRCHGSLPWTAPSLASCPCGHALAEATAPCASTEEFEWLPSFLALLEGSPLPGMKIEGLGASACAHMVVLLGMLLSPNWEGPRRIRDFGQKSAADVSAVMRTGIRAVTTWPGPLDEFVARLRRGARHRHGRYGLAHELGSDVVEWLLNLPHADYGAVIRTAMTECIADNPLTLLHVARSRALGPKGSCLTKREAARRLGSSVETLSRGIAQGRLASLGRGGRGIPIAIDAQKVTAIARDRESIIGLKEAAARLGTTTARVRALAAAGMLKPVPTPLGPGNAFRAEEVAYFMADIESRVRCRPVERLCSLGEAAGLFKQAGGAFPDLVALVLGNRLAPTAITHTRRGLGALLFERAEIIALARSKREAGDLLPLQAVARHLGVKWEVVDHLVRTSMLPLACNRGHRQARLVARGQLSAFEEEFTVGAALAREFQTSPRRIDRLLRERGVLPAVGPGIDGSRQNVYVRRDIAAAFPASMPALIS